MAKKFISQDLHITFGCIFPIQQRLISRPLYWKATLKILNGKNFNLRILRPRKINDYVRSSFMIFRIANARLTVPLFSMKQIFTPKGNLFPRNYTFVLCCLGNFKIHKCSTLSKIYRIQNFYLELSWDSTLIYPAFGNSAKYVPQNSIKISIASVIFTTVP